MKQETEVHQTMLTLEQLLMMADAVNATEAGARAETATVTWIQVALLVYLAGIVFFAFRNVYSLVRLLMLLKSGKKEEMCIRDRVIYNDRVVPFNTLARDFVLKLTGKSSYGGMTPEQVIYNDRVVSFNTLARDFVLKLTGKSS